MSTAERGGSGRGGGERRAGGGAGRGKRETEPGGRGGGSRGPNPPGPGVRGGPAGRGGGRRRARPLPAGGAGGPKGLRQKRLVGGIRARRRVLQVRRRRDAENRREEPDALVLRAERRLAVVDVPVRRQRRVARIGEGPGGHDRHDREGRDEDPFLHLSSPFVPADVPASRTRSWSVAARSSFRRALARCHSTVLRLSLSSSATARLLLPPVTSRTTCSSDRRQLWHGQGTLLLFL